MLAKRKTRIKIKILERSKRIWAKANAVGRCRVGYVGWTRGQLPSPADGGRRWGGRRVAPTASSMVLVLDGDDCSAD